MYAQKRSSKDAHRAPKAEHDSTINQNDHRAFLYSTFSHEEMTGALLNKELDRPNI